LHWFAGTGPIFVNSFSNFSHIAGTEQLSPCIGLLVLD
jgi:hypothetical protein